MTEWSDFQYEYLCAIVFVHCSLAESKHVPLIRSLLGGFTELKMTEWKTTVHISFSSQRGIAALKNVFTYGRLTRSPPLPPTTHPLSHLPTTPIPIGAVWGEIYEPFMGLKSQVESTPPRPGQLGRAGSGEDLTRLNSRVQKPHLCFSLRCVRLWEYSAKNVI